MSWLLWLIYNFDGDWGMICSDVKILFWEDSPLVMVKVGFNPLLVCVRHGWSLYWAGSGDEEVVRRLSGGGVGAGQERGPMSRCSLLRPPALTAPADQLPGDPRHNFTVDSGGPAKYYYKIWGRYPGFQWHFLREHTWNERFEIFHW